MDEMDAKVQKLSAKIAAEKELIKKAKSKPSWNTNNVFISKTETTNLNIVKDVKEFVRILAELMVLRDSHQEAVSDLGLELKFEYQGFTYEQWFEDIQNHITRLTLKTREQKLSSMEKTLETLVSPEMRRKLELERLESEMNQ